METHSHPGPRKITRLADWDYSRPGAYTVTICTHDRVCLFGDVVNGEMQLNAAGRIVAEEWRQIPVRYPFVILDEFVVMPNHVHGILFLDPPEIISPVGAQFIAPSSTSNRTTPPDARNLPEGAINRAPTLGDIIRAFKARATWRIRKETACHCIWQRNFHDHIIRDRHDLQNHRHYIFNNPANWLTDEENLVSGHDMSCPLKNTTRA